MKRLMTMLAIGLAFGATAAPEKVLDVQLADSKAIVAAATKFGEFAGEPSLGVMVAAGLAQPPEEFNRMSGTNRMALYVDTAKEDIEEAFDGAEPKYETSAALAAGEVVRVNVNEKGIAFLVRAMDEALKGETDVQVKTGVEQIKTFAKMCKAATISVCVVDAGLDLKLGIVPVEGSILSKAGDKSFTAADPLAFAGKGALYAIAYAADSCAGDFGAQWQKISDVLAKNGVKTDFLKTIRQGSNLKFTLDVPALVKYAQGDAKAVFESIASDTSKGQKFLADLQGAMPKDLVLENPEQGAAFYVDGVTTPDTASQRFAKAMPGAMAKKPCAVGLLSIYGSIKTVLAKVADFPECKEGATIKAVLQGMPSEVGADTAILCWKDAKGLNSQIRLTPAEIKGLATIAKTATMAVGGMVGCGTSCELEDDDDDDDDND